MSLNSVALPPISFLLPPSSWRSPCTAHDVGSPSPARRFSLSRTVLALLALSLAGCSGTEVSELVGPDGVRCLTELTGVPTSVPGTASQTTGVVATERECSWAAASSASWLTVSPATGQGETTLTLTIAANGTSTTRSATLIVNDARVTLTQAAGSSQPTTQPPSTSVTFSGSVSNLIGACPVLTFSVAGRQVITDGNTRFTGGNCNSVRNGRSVEIEGEQISASLVRATRVRQ